MAAPMLELRDREAVVFGGSGFIGSHLVSSLARAGASVTIGDVEPPAAPLPEGVRYVEADVREPISHRPRAVAPLVFNLAAVHRTPGHPDREYFETNVAGARNVTAFCARHEVDSLWFTSSISVYGPSEEPREESSPLQPASAYGRSKLEAEGIHREWAAQGERRLIVVRPAAVFGPGENGNFTRLAAGLKKGFFFYPGRRDTIKACGYVGDLVKSMYFMWGRAEPVVTYNYGYPEPPTLERICRAFHDAGGLPLPRGTIPTAPMLAVARALSALGLKTFDPERVRKLTASTNIEARELQRAGFVYGTDLHSAIARWREADPYGQFV